MVVTCPPPMAALGRKQPITTYRYRPKAALRSGQQSAKSRPTYQPKKPGAICEAFALKVDQNL